MKTAVYEEIGTVMRKKRLKSGYTQWEAANLLGYSSPQFVSNFERGLCILPIRALKILGNTYSMSDKEILQLLVRAHRRYWIEEMERA